MYCQSIVKRIETLDENLQRIKELSGKVTPFHNLLEKKESDLVSIATLQGDITIEKLTNKEDYSVVEAVLSKDTIMDWHTHKNIEIIIIIKGKLQIENNHFLRVVGENEIMVIQEGMSHKVTALEQTVSLTVLIPADKFLQKG